MAIKGTSVRDVRKFISFAVRKLGLASTPTIHLVGSTENSRNAFGHFMGTGKSNTISVRMTDRHPIDVMRTIAHELCHYKQRVMHTRASEQQREDEANAMAGRIMRDFDTTHPNVFRDKPIKEDMGVAAMGGAVNNIGDGNIAKFDPLLSKKGAIIKRKAPVEEDNAVKNLLGGGEDGGMFKRAGKSTTTPKGLRAIIGGEYKKDKRADTRNS